MADTLTQIQQALDQLNTQFYASIRYINTHHSPSPLPPSQTADHSVPNSANADSAAPVHTTAPLTNGQTTPPNSTQVDPTDILPADHVTTPASTFSAAQKELAHDLILKSRQIQGLIDALPGVERGREEQEQRIGALEVELQEARRERAGVEGERRRMVERVETVLGGVRR